MKKIIVLIIVLFSFCSFSQVNDKSEIFSSFKFGALAGVNLSNLIGGVFTIEGKTNLTSNLNIKLSAGYSTINKKEGYNVKTYGPVVVNNVTTYQISSYNVDKILYDVFPVSVGFEYVFLHNNFSPYGIVETGYNFYTFHTQVSYNIIPNGRSYNSAEEVPSEYKGTPPVITKAASYRFALGLGTTYKISNGINLDIRYLFQANKYIENTHQILFGINF